MKILIKVFLILFFCFSKSLAQTEKNISFIKDKYKIITALLEKEKLTEVVLESECKDNGQNRASLTFYYNNNSLVYMLHSYDQGHNSYTNHYYLDDDKLMFYFSENVSWIWDFECAPKQQEVSNEIWTYEEQRIYFNNEIAQKCLFKTYNERSIDQPYEGEGTLSETIKNQEVNCDIVVITQIMKKYNSLRSIQKNTTQNICDISID